MKTLHWNCWEGGEGHKCYFKICSKQVFQHLGMCYVGLTGPLKDFVFTDVKGIGIFKINVDYHTLSDLVFIVGKGDI